MGGVSLLLAHPEIPSCADCQKWIYDPKTWRRSERNREPVPRSANHPPPCSSCPKIPKGKAPLPENAVELLPQNLAAYRFWLEIKAGRPMPNDPVVWRNCALCCQAESLQERGLMGTGATLLNVLGSVTVQNGLNVKRR